MATFYWSTDSVTGMSRCFLNSKPYNRAIPERIRMEMKGKRGGVMLLTPQFVQEYLFIEGN